MFLGSRVLLHLHRNYKSVGRQYGTLEWLAAIEFSRASYRWYQELRNNFMVMTPRIRLSLGEPVGFNHPALPDGNLPYRRAYSVLAAEYSRRIAMFERLIARSQYARSR